MSQQRVCIFCGGTPVTKEHVWPQWLTKDHPQHLLHRKDDGIPIHRDELSEGSDGTLSATTRLEYRGRSATVARHVVKAACATCNNGWMSVLESEAKPMLLKHSENRMANLSDAERLVLVRWLLKSAAVYEFDDPASAVIPAAAREAIMTGAWVNDDAWGVESVWTGMGFRHNHVVERSYDPDTGEAIGIMLYHQVGFARAGYIVRRVIEPGLYATPHSQALTRSLALWPDAVRGRRPELDYSSWYSFGFKDRGRS